MRTQTSIVYVILEFCSHIAEVCEDCLSPLLVRTKDTMTQEKVLPKKYSHSIGCQPDPSVTWKRSRARGRRKIWKCRFRFH
jgi:hypothetical protein